MTRILTTRTLKRIISIMLLSCVCIINAFSVAPVAAPVSSTLSITSSVLVHHGMCSFHQQTQRQVNANTNTNANVNSIPISRSTPLSLPLSSTAMYSLPTSTTMPTISSSFHSSLLGKSPLFHSSSCSSSSSILCCKASISPNNDNDNDNEKQTSIVYRIYQNTIAKFFRFLKHIFAKIFKRNKDESNDYNNDNEVLTNTRNAKEQVVAAVTDPLPEKEVEMEKVTVSRANTDVNGVVNGVKEEEEEETKEEEDEVLVTITDANLNDVEIEQEEVVEEVVVLEAEEDIESIAVEEETNAPKIEENVVIIDEPTQQQQEEGQSESTVSNSATAAEVDDIITTETIANDESTDMTKSTTIRATTATIKRPVPELDEISNTSPTSSPESLSEQKYPPIGKRWAVAAPNIDLSASWKIIVTDRFKKEYDAYLKNLGQPSLVRSIAVSIVELTTEEMIQTESGRKLTIRGKNLRGVWERTLVASGADCTVEFDESSQQHDAMDLVTADKENVKAEAWWEDEGTVHRSYLRGVKKYGGGDFESRRFLEDDGNTLICESIFHPKDGGEPAVIKWSFMRTA